jgi:hypothetical protein
MTFLDGKNVLLIHDPWMHGFVYGDTDDWLSIYLALSLPNLNKVYIYIPYDVSIYGITRYHKCVQTIGSKQPYDNRYIIDSNDTIETIVNECDVIGLMAPLKHDNDTILKQCLNSIEPNTKLLFTQGETGKYNRNASLGIDSFLNMAHGFTSNETKFRKDGLPYSFKDLSEVIPMKIIRNIMLPYKLYKLFCPPPLSNPYVPVLYLNGGTNICAIHELAIELNISNILSPIGPNKLRICEQNNYILYNLAEFDLPLHMYIIQDKPELNEPMKYAFTSLIVVARMFGMYNGKIEKLYNLSEAPPLSNIPSFDSLTNPMWDGNTLLMVNSI